MENQIQLQLQLHHFCIINYNFNYNYVIGPGSDVCQHLRCCNLHQQEEDCNNGDEDASRDPRSVETRTHAKRGHPTYTTHYTYRRGYSRWPSSLVRSCPETSLFLGAPDVLLLTTECVCLCLTVSTCACQCLSVSDCVCMCMHVYVSLGRHASVCVCLSITAMFNLG